MGSLPLHPAIVHVPLGLAFIMPFLALGFAWALWTGRVRTRAWLVIALLQAVLVGAGLAATNTGEAEEDRVERRVPHAAIEQHEEYAELFVWGTAITFALMGLVLVVRPAGAVRALTGAAVLGTFAVAGLGVLTGHAGGQLVYVHNAGAAYSSGTRPEGAPGRP